MTSCSSCGTAIPPGAKFCPDCGTKVVESSAPGDALIGRTLNDKYRIVSPIGAGSMGTVYLAEHIGLNKRVALKVLRSDLDVNEETLQRFQREGIAAGKFSHPNAIQIFDFDHVDKVFYLAMEYVEGLTLTDYMREHGSLSIDVSLEITRQVLSALVAAHEQGIVHRDLKPDNIMIVESGTGELSAKVLDFGLSKLVHVPLGASLATQPGRIMGTPRYMAPEQGSGEKVDHRSDLYAVGLMLYEMLAGQQPFQADTVRELFVKQATEPPKSLLEVQPDIPASLDELCAVALSKSRADRYQSAVEMLEELNEIDHEIQDSSPRAAGRRARTTPRRRVTKAAPARRARGESSSKKPFLVPAIIGAVVAVAAGVFALKGLGGGAAPDDAGPPPRISMKPAAERTEQEVNYVSLLDDARVHMASGDLDLALSKAEKAQLSPLKDSEAYLVRAQVYRQKGDDDTALIDFREATRLDPSYAAAMVGQGWIELDRGDQGVALQTFERAADADPRSGAALAGQGAVHFERGQLDQAEKVLRKASELDKECASAHYYLGRVLHARDDLDGALREFIEAKRNDPRDWRPLAALGGIYLAQDRPSEAEQQFRDAIDRNANALPAVNGLAALLVDRERFRDASDLLERNLQKNPGAERLLVLQAIVRQAENDTKGALESLQKAVRSGVEDARVHTLLGTLYQQSGQHQQALDEYAAAIELDDEAFTAQKNRGLVLFQLERYDEAEIALRSAIVIDEDDPYAHFALALVCMDYLDKPDDAAIHFTAYQELGGDDPRVDAWLRRVER